MQRGHRRWSSSVPSVDTEPHNHFTTLMPQFTTVSGGISNVNAKLSPRADLGLEPVMFKVFGDKTEQIIDREAEKVVVVALGVQGFGPKVLATATAVEALRQQQLHVMTLPTVEAEAPAVAVEAEAVTCYG